MTVRRTKPKKSSPTFENINQERLKQCEQTKQSARKAIETSRRLTAESRELIETIREKRKKAR